MDDVHGLTAFSDALKQFLTVLQRRELEKKNLKSVMRTRGSLFPVWIYRLFTYPLLLL